MKISIIGNGDWGRRLFDIYSKHYQVSIAGGRDSAEKLNDTVIIAIPGKYFVDVILKNIHELTKAKVIYSASKGLTSSGLTPMEYLIRLLPDAKIKIRHLGGPNIKGCQGIIEIGGFLKEKRSILKNIYAIGFGMALYQGGINYAADFLGQCIEELGVADRDLIASCYSDYSRNRFFGYMLAKGVITVEEAEKMTIEGLYSAQMVALWDRYKDLRIIREVSLNIIQTK